MAAMLTHSMLLGNESSSLSSKTGQLARLAWPYVMMIRYGNEYVKGRPSVNSRYNDVEKFRTPPGCVKCGPRSIRWQCEDLEVQVEVALETCT